MPYRPSAVGVGVGAAYGLVKALLSLLFVLIALMGIVGYIWGGTNDGHILCLDHRLGDNSLLASAACAVEH